MPYSTTPFAVLSFILRGIALTVSLCNLRANSIVGIIYEKKNNKKTNLKTAASHGRHDCQHNNRFDFHLSIRSPPLFDRGAYTIRFSVRAMCCSLPHGLCLRVITTMKVKRCDAVMLPQTLRIKRGKNRGLQKATTTIFSEHCSIHSTPAADVTLKALRTSVV